MSSVNQTVSWILEVQPQGQDSWPLEYGDPNRKHTYVNKQFQHGVMKTMYNVCRKSHEDPEVELLNGMAKQ